MLTEQAAPPERRPGTGDGARARRRLRWPGALVLTMVLVLAAAGAAFLVRSEPGVAADSGPLQAVVLSGSSLSYAQAQQVADDLGWQARVYTLPGSGITRSTLHAGGSLSGQAAQLIAAEASPPDVVVVQGGEADHVAGAMPLRQATEQLVQDVRRHAAAARLVLVGPIPGGEPPQSMRATNAMLAEVAAALDVVYVDPIALGWRAGDPAVTSGLVDELARAVR